MAQYLTTAEVVERLRPIVTSKKCLAVLVRDSGFPPPLKINRRKYLWVDSEVDAWLQAKLASRDAA